MPFDLIPYPQVLKEQPGSFQLTEDLVIAARGAATDAGWLLHDALRAGTGLTPPVVPDAPGRPAITLTLSGDSSPQFPDPAREAYRLEVQPEGVSVEAAHPAGLTRAVQTLRQLLPANTLRNAPISTGPVHLPGIYIDDAPRFGWRGVMLDVARYFHPKDFVLKLIDLAALHQLDVVHLHLTDDQGWRLEVPGWPRLTEVAAWRAETVVGHASSSQTFDGTPHGGYYTAADLREIVAYAARRHITVVPEIDLPGHVRAVLAAYPELGNTGAAKPVATTFGIFPEVLAPTDDALRFARDVFDVVTDIFDAPFVHIGGDECPRTEWRESPAARARADELGLADVDHLQSWFTRQFADHLRGQGRRVIGWDEILDDGGAPADAVVAVWRDFAAARTALDAGHDVIVAPQDAVYLDYYPSERNDEPLHIHGHTPVEKIAAFEPVPDPGTEPSAAGPGSVLGVQAQLWSEYLPTPRDVEYAAFPRLAAVADMAWTTAENRRHYPVTRRLPAHLSRLDALGVNYRPLDGPQPWQRGGTGARARTSG